MSELKINQEANNGLKPIERRVLANFFSSFHHSQGNPPLQTLMSIHVARQYNKDDIGLIDAFEARLKPHIERLKVPGEHIKEKVDEATGKVMLLDDKFAQENEAGFQSQWGRLMMIFNRVFYDKPDVRFMNWMGGYEGAVYKANELSPDQFMYQMVDYIIGEDLNYQKKPRPKKPRPNRKEKSDPHSSHLQSYLFASEPTQSPEYERLYSDIGTFIEKFDITGLPHGGAEKIESGLRDKQVISLRGKFHALVQTWEKNHPGKHFIQQ